MTQQIPTPDELIRPAFDALIGARPRALPHVESGSYGDVLAGWKAETRLNRSRLVGEVSATRLPYAKGDALRYLARSEYWYEPDTGAKPARGEAMLERQVVNESSSPTGNFARGVIGAGARIRKVANSVVTPKVTEAIYLTELPLQADDVDTSTVDIGGGSYRHTQQIVISHMVCDRPGAHGNTPSFVLEALPEFKLDDTLFDPKWKCVFGRAGGGSDGLTDAALRVGARANYRGQFGPTKGALVAGALADTGAEHVLAIDDNAVGVTVVYLADQSWGISTYFLAEAKRILRKSREGFGCRLTTAPIYNQRITVDATVLAAGQSSTASTPDIAKSVQRALRAYFDDSPNFYAWDIDTIGGIVAGADDRLLTCTGVVVRRPDGSPIASPSPVFVSASPFAVHYYLADDAVRLTFETPV